MISLLGNNYYVDLNALDNIVGMFSENENGESEKVTDLVKFEMVKLMLEVVLSEREEIDENLGVHSSKNLSIPFKLAFNTLLLNKIINKL